MKADTTAPQEEVLNGQVFEGTALSRRPGERFTVGQDPEHASPLVRRWLAIGTVRRVETEEQSR